MKIAVPVEGENLTIVKRTGQAPFFALFEDTVFQCIVQAPKSGHGHHDDHDHHHGDDEEHIEGHGKSLTNLKGVELMLVRMIGEHMQAAVKRSGIRIKKIREKHGEQADEAVKNFLKGDSA